MGRVVLGQVFFWASCLGASCPDPVKIKCQQLSNEVTKVKFNMPSSCCCVGCTNKTGQGQFIKVYKVP